MLAFKISVGRIDALNLGADIAVHFSDDPSDSRWLTKAQARELIAQLEGTLRELERQSPPQEG